MIRVDFFASGVCAFGIGVLLAFVRSGNVNVNDGKVYNVGNSGYGRSRTASSSTNAYYLNFNPTDVNPSNNNHRWYGFPLRCL